jgi:hypothetical protein
MTIVRPIEIELGGTYVAPFWPTSDQLRTSAALLAALVRRLEEAPGTTVGARERLNLDRDGSAPQIHDLEHLRDADVAAIGDRDIQEAVVLLDGNPTAYRLRTDGVGRGMLILDVPELRCPAIIAALQAVVDEARSRGHIIRIPALE